ncbi:hypothetical protein GCM10011452_21460 [Gemmobacter lanyuensis]|uniref:Thiamine biosynthesis protein ThiS n=1 Tax=Gemmobacter lanyuensis TaxID=1054497 RepID=A0A918IUG1_9RHOB|nr:sulfur carrier protein ThiS [Gemmobacter lanyuensis]GGW32742.1 hypothetical protein GCM10011452_21460 [Gemmobacter lanyuensis]
MRLEVNGTPQELRATTLSDLIDELGYEAACVATALNGHFVPLGLRGATPLSEGAKVEVLAPMQGG